MFGANFLWSSPRRITLESDARIGSISQFWPPLLYLPCVFNFPSSVHCKDVTSTFWMNQSGKCWLNWVGTLQMDLKCPNLVCDSHMTWYIAKNIQNKPLKHILMAFCWNVQNIPVNFWFGTLWSHDLVHFEHIWHYPKPGHCCHICLVHLKYSRHILI